MITRPFGPTGVPVAVIGGTTDPAHVRENAGALDCTLTREEMRAIDGAA